MEKAVDSAVKLMISHIDRLNRLIDDTMNPDLIERNRYILCGEANIINHLAIGTAIMVSPTWNENSDSKFHLYLFSAKGNKKLI